MSQLTKPFYNATKPDNDEIVLVIFTKEEDSYFEGTLVEYTGKVFLRKEDATKKKRVSSWNNIVPLNVEKYAKVYDLNFSNDTIQVSLTNLDDDLTNIQEHFSKNKRLISLIVTISFQLSTNVDTIWESVIYKINDERLKYNEENDNNDDITYTNILDYIMNNIEHLKKTLDDDKVIIKIEKMLEDKPFKMLSTIGIISNNGVENTTNLLKKVLEEITYEYSLKYSYYKKKNDTKTFPVYLFETSSEDSTEENHSNFIQALKDKAMNANIHCFEQCKKIST
jgi:translation initiation factor 2 alpha subunit (eIF-2alpha)